MKVSPPVLFIVFRRPETTAQVFDAIRAARPARLFVAADGPRLDRPGEAEACAVVRGLVAKVDWPCELQTRFRETNVGAGRNVAEAISWFLEECNEGLILEDDCLPHPDFFTFTAQMLDRYRDDERIMHVSGSNFRSGRRLGEESYVFSRYNHGWGWATWKRAWGKFDPTMASLDGFLRRADEVQFWDTPRERRYWSKVFRQAKRGEMDAWDYQWKLSVWKEGALCICPEANLITNLGFGSSATNTLDGDSHKGGRPLEPMGEVLHPEFVLRHRPGDRENFLQMYWGTPLERWRHRVHKALAWMRPQR